MASDPVIGLVYHWIGGLAAASFYIPFKRVRGWAWETYWLVGGVFSWIIAPIVLASILVPGLWDVLREAPGRSIGWAYVWGLLWGVGGLTFGLSVRYLGIALGYALVLGLCTAFGTLMPPLFEGTFGALLRENSGRAILFGVATCLAGITFSGLAGVSKERELTGEQKAGSVREFNFTRGLMVATLSGVLSAAFAYGLAAGKPIADLAATQLAARGGSDLWQNLPVLVVILLGGFTTNFAWCAYLNVKNRTAHQYAAFRTRDVAEISASEAVTPWDVEQLDDGGAGNGGGNTAVATQPRTAAAVAPARSALEQPVPLFANYAFAALAGVCWYLQFFFYSMGSTRMGKYEFSSWTLHMASIIIFSTLWGVALKEWRGTSGRTRALIGLGLAVLIASTVIVGYGNSLKGGAPAH